MLSQANSFAADVSEIGQRLRTADKEVKLWFYNILIHASITFNYYSI